MKPTLYADWREKVVFSKDGVQPQTLVDEGGFKALVAGLEAGQKIPVHPEGLAVYYFLEGTGWMTVDEERFAVGPGSIVLTPGGSSRGMEAETRLAFLASRIAER